MKDLKKLTDADLNKTIDEKRKALLDLRFNMSGSSKRGSKDSGNMKKDIAKMLTEVGIRNLKSGIRK